MKLALHRVIGLAMACALAGCMTVEKALDSLPAISAAEFHAATSTAAGSMQVDAVNLQATDEAVTASTLNVQVTVPGAGTTSVSIKGYRRARSAP
jgi:hypothetical protein